MSTTLPPSPPRAYRIERFIGRGGFGHVYLASPLSEGTLGRVALKVMDEGAAEEWVARFYHEAQILSRLSGYPSFVHVNAVFRMERRFCIDMEYVAGLTLDALISRMGGLPPAVAFTITRHVASALDAAANRARDEGGALLRVLHRDMKPGNLRLGPGGVVKILDFGLARSELRGRPETQKVLPATLAYMAPERFGFRADIGAPADVYALGLTCYEMLAGRPFFHDPQLSAFLAADRDELAALTEERLASLPDDVSPEARALLSRALSIAPEARLTAAELERGCRELLGVHGEDAWRDWVERVLEPLQREGSAEPTVDPWRWVGTVRRSDVEREGPVHAHETESATAVSTYPPAEASPTLAVAETVVVPDLAAPRRRAGRALGVAALVLVGALAALWVAQNDNSVAWYSDRDGDGHGVGVAEPGPDAAVRPGFARATGDCDDARADVFPGAAEACDGADQDCDGAIDEDLPAQTWFRDGDGDGAGGEAWTSCATAAPAGSVAAGGDCDDADPRRSADCGGARPVAPATKPPAAVSADPPAAPGLSEPPATPAAQGRVSMSGAEATRVRLDGPSSLVLSSGAERSVPAGTYTAKIEFEGGDYTLDVVVPAEGSVLFDCSTRQMGRPCKVR